MKIDFIRTHPDSKLPVKNHAHPSLGDSGFDLFSIADIAIPPGGSAVVPIGLKLGYVTPGYWFRIEARSGLGFKKGIQPHFGVIDNGYRGDLGIKLYNLSNEVQLIEKGTAAAQFIPYEMLMCEVGIIAEPAASLRGENGFGSSDSRSA